MGIKAPFGAVRNIYTPQGGHRVNELNQLRSGMHVVAGGVERFRKLECVDFVIAIDNSINLQGIFCFPLYHATLHSCLKLLYNGCLSSAMQT